METLLSKIECHLFNDWKKRPYEETTPNDKAYAFLDNLYETARDEKNDIYLSDIYVQPISEFSEYVDIEEKDILEAKKLEGELEQIVDEHFNELKTKYNVSSENDLFKN
jgi:hypothetical protein|tara:strand:- start:251 stop:577 length:327 start_codon:yes stop_codon:yes gene_type:complete